MRRGVRVVVLASLLLLSTCQPSASTTQSSPTASLTISSSPTSYEKSGPPAPMITLPAPRVDSYERLGGLLLRKVDPATLQDPPGFSPISLGEDADLAVRPDGSSLATILRYFHPYSNQPPTPLYLVDLEVWAVKETGVVIGGLLTAAPAFAPDGRTLWWIESEADSGGQVLHRYSLDRQTDHQVTELPGGSVAHDFQPLGDDRAALYLREAGEAEAERDLPPAWPRLLVVEDGEVVHDLELGGVLHGWLPTGPPEACCWNEPSLAWELQKGLLYVVHAGADTVTVVDLERGILEQAEVRPRLSALGRLGAWLAPPALAKEVYPRPSSALLSPDRSRLHVSGYAGDPDWERPGHYLRDPQPVRIIDTDTLTEAGPPGSPCHGDGPLS